MGHHPKLSPSEWHVSKVSGSHYFSKLLLLLQVMSVYLHVFMCVTLVPVPREARGWQKIPLGLELQMIMNFSVSALTHWVISPGLPQTHTQVHAYTCMYTRMHTHMHAHTHVRTHTHACTSALPSERLSLLLVSSFSSASCNEETFGNERRKPSRSKHREGCSEQTQYSLWLQVKAHC